MIFLKKFFQFFLRAGVSFLILTGLIIGLYRGVTGGFFSSSAHPVFEENRSDIFTKETAHASEEYFFDATRAGSLRVGMLLTDMRKAINPWWVDVILTRKEASLFEEYIVHDASSDPLLRVVPACSVDGICRVDTIEIISSKFKTSYGVGVGNTYADLKEKNIITTIQQNSARIFADTSLGVTFVFNGAYLLSEQVRYEVEDIEEGAVIESILLRRRN